MWTAVLHLSWNGEVGAGDGVVGLGTLALAFFTWRLARQTKADVDVSRDSIAVSREAIEAADMPFVIPSSIPQDSPFNLHSTDFPAIRFEQAGPMHWLAVRLCPAIVRDLRLDLDGAELLAPMRNHFPVAAEQAHDLNAELQHAFVPADGERPGTLTVTYSHASGSLYRTECAVTIRMRYIECESYERSTATTTRISRTVRMPYEVIEPDTGQAGRD
jgi:hypothetical protein